MTKNINAKKEAIEKFCHDNLKELCIEILEWQNTGLLRDGLLRKLAREHLNYDSGDGDLSIAERQVTRCAMKVLSEQE